jgi:hypothetical protein
MIGSDIQNDMGFGVIGVVLPQRTPRFFTKLTKNKTI